MSPLQIPIDRAIRSEHARDFPREFVRHRDCPFAVHLLSDQWCDYCAATDRCLAFKCRPDAGDGNIYRNIEERMFESLHYLNACYEAEGRTPPEELASLLNGERTSAVATRTFRPVDDPLERMGKHYAVLVTAFLVTCGQPLPSGTLPKREHGPTPFEVLVYYHVLIASKIYRAISSSLEAARTRRCR
jgi:hypothetical protein